MFKIIDTIDGEELGFENIDDCRTYLKEVYFDARVHGEIDQLFDAYIRKEPTYELEAYLGLTIIG